MFLFLRYCLNEGNTNNEKALQIRITIIPMKYGNIKSVLDANASGIGIKFSHLLHLVSNT
jgi:hypothetical protein